MEPAPQRYEFGPYRIDTGERLLHRGEELISLPPKAIETLLALVTSAGRMVDKGDLLTRVWPDTFVEEGALTRNISLLRKTLGDMTDEASYIETIPKRGYRFVAPVRTVSLESGVVHRVETPEPQPRSWRALALVVISALVAAGALAGYIYFPRRTTPATSVDASGSALAVLPFRNVINDPSQEYFVDGMTEALITGLAKMGKLRVISLATGAGARGESAALDAVVRDQSAHFVVKGTVLRSGNRVRIDAQLLDPKTRTVYWANYYERDMKDVLALESAVAEAIAREIQVGITAEERQRLREHRPISPEALDAYMRGRYFWNRRTEEGLRRAAQYFQQAIAAEPGYALAYSGLADSYSLLGSIGIDGMPPTTAMPMAKAAAQRALEMDPGLAEAHVSLAYIKLSYDWDLAGASEEFSRAMALNPAWATAHHWYSHYYMAAGDLSKAMEEMQAALRLEPLSPSINVGVGWCFYYLRQYDKALEQYRAVLEVDPTFALAHQQAGMAYQQKGMYAEAIEQFKVAESLTGESPAAVASLASVYGAAGRTPEARRELARLEEMSRRRYVPAFYFAAVYYAMGQLPAAFNWGKKARDERCDYFMYLPVEPRVGKLAGHPEFVKLLNRFYP